MPIVVPIKLTCDHEVHGMSACFQTAETTAPLKATKTLSKTRLDLRYSKEPPGWSIKLEDASVGFGTRYDPEIKCYCPEHTKEREESLRESAKKTPSPPRRKP